MAHQRPASLVRSKVTDLLCANKRLMTLNACRLLY